MDVRKEYRTGKRYAEKIKDGKPAGRIYDSYRDFKADHPDMEPVPGCIVIDPDTGKKADGTEDWYGHPQTAILDFKAKTGSRQTTWTMTDAATPYRLFARVDALIEVTPEEYRTLRDLYESGSSGLTDMLDGLFSDRGRVKTCGGYLPPDADNNFNREELDF